MRMEMICTTLISKKKNQMTLFVEKAAKHIEALKQKSKQNSW